MVRMPQQIADALLRNSGGNLSLAHRLYSIDV
jgi:hypothetical protein